MIYSSVVERGWGRRFCLMIKLKFFIARVVTESNGSFLGCHCHIEDSIHIILCTLPFLVSIDQICL